MPFASAPAGAQAAEVREVGAARHPPPRGDPAPQAGLQAGHAEPQFRLRPLDPGDVVEVPARAVCRPTGAGEAAAPRSRIWIIWSQKLSWRAKKVIYHPNYVFMLTCPGAAGQGAGHAALR